ncbi:hypothetical protein NFO65_13095 [Neorhizobium galegae]|uniref:hypothetical protein n=1 Tax=Neorhizobium galegae TaxID=399 RepID=UPI00210157B3|nr:hypothetical protein [Neorhizobium galegae]MCQ1571668.1 hypothetical protein [Neorhizobium galegae]
MNGDDLRKDWGDWCNTTGCVACFYTHRRARGSRDRKIAGPAVQSALLGSTDRVVRQSHDFVGIDQVEASRRLDR